MVCTVREFIVHLGYSPTLRGTLFVIESDNLENIDVKIWGEWFTTGWPEIRLVFDCDEIESIKVRGQAYDGSDWEWSAEVGSLDAMDNARRQLNAAYNAHMDQVESEWGDRDAD